MSFGFGVGDFLAVIRLANEVRSCFAQAPTEYKAISGEVESLSSALDYIETLDAKDFDDKQQAELNRIIQSCHLVLQDLQSKLNKLHVLGDSAPDWKRRVQQAWKKVRWDQAEIMNYRSRIVSNISLLNIVVGNINRKGVQWLIQNQDHHRRNTILSWLSQASPALRQSEVFNSHQKGTGSWLLQTDQFQEWISGEGQILFCPGIPGSGKTVLSSIIIDHLEQVFPDGDDIGIAYLFCDHRQQQTLVELYSALLRQAVQRRSSIPERIESLYESFCRKGTRPSAADILCELRAILAPCTRAFVILDALDECPVNDGNGSIRQPFLRELVRLQNEVGFNLLATSRPDQEIASHLQSGDVVEIRAREEDIRHYVDARLDDLPSFVRKRPTLQQHIRDSITETAKDMFLLARLYFNLLLAETNERGIRRVLQQFGSGSESNNAYDYAYDETMGRIERQGPNAADLAKKTIGWIINAKRILTAAELEHALAIEVGSPEFDEANITDMEQLTAYCCGLVTLDEQTTQVKLVHYTTQKYFEKSWKKWFPDIHRAIADSCLTYVAYDLFEDERFSAPDEVNQIKLEYPFYNYAASYWGRHFREFPGDDMLALKFLQNKAKVSGYYRCGLNPFSQTLPRPSGLAAAHIVAYFNLEHIMQQLLDVNPDELDIQNSENETPLFLAAYYGHLATAELLLNRGAQYSIQGTNGRTPLHAAAGQGHISIVALFLDKGVDIEISDSTANSPLCTAAEKGAGPVVTLLLDRGANINTKNTRGLTPLHLASLSGHEAVAQQLLNRGANLESRSNNGNHPLHAAALNGKFRVAKLFLDEGVSIDITNHAGETPLHVASDVAFDGILDLKGINATIELLLERGASTEARDKDGQTPLHLTASRRNKTLAQVLLDHGANIEARSNDGHTPLHLATNAIWRRTPAPKSGEFIEMLVDRGASVDPVSHIRVTPLSMAASMGDEAVVQLLLAKNANANISDHSGHTPLFLAAWRGHYPVVRLLLDNGACLNPPGTGPRHLDLRTAVGKDHGGMFWVALEEEGNPDHFNIHGRTPLHMASAGGHVSVARLLLDAGAQPDSQDRYGRTPLFNAVCGGHFAIARLLLDLPDVDRHRADIWGITPAMEAKKRDLRELSSLLCEADPAIEPQVAHSSKEAKAPSFCDICLIHFDEGEESYACGDFSLCRFCSPVVKGICLICGKQLEHKINTSPEIPIVVQMEMMVEEQCVCM